MNLDDLVDGIDVLVGQDPCKATYSIWRCKLKLIYGVSGITGTVPSLPCKGSLENIDICDAGWRIPTSSCREADAL